MIDLVTYCPDPALLVQEVANRFPRYLTEGEQYSVCKTPVQYSRPPATATLALVRCRTDQEESDLRSLATLEVLGTYQEVFADPAKLAKYNSVYDRTPVVLTDAEGNTENYQPPERFGVFA